MEPRSRSPEQTSIPPRQIAFGSTAGTNVDVISSTSITVTSPKESAQTVDITVTTTSGGTSSTTTLDEFTFSAISITSISPDDGDPSGGYPVAIAGSFTSATPTVDFGSTAATITSHTTTLIEVVAPLWIRVRARRSQRRTERALTDHSGVVLQLRLRPDRYRPEPEFPARQRAEQR